MHKWYLLLLLIVCLLLVTLAASPVFAQTDAGDSQPVQASPTTTTLYLPFVRKLNPTVFGVESYNIQGTNLWRMQEIHPAFVRRNGLLWSAVESTKGIYDWSKAAFLEQDLINARNNGIEVVLVVRSTPLWAQDNPYAPDHPLYCGRILQSELPAFGDFMYAAVDRYSKPPFSVKYWQIWNEPDADPDWIGEPERYESPYGCMGDDADPYYGGDYFGDILAAIYPRIKQADPTAQVVIGGLLLSCPFDPANPDNPICNYRQSLFLEGILRHHGANDGKNFFDIVAFHSYEYYTDVDANNNPITPITGSLPWGSDSIDPAKAEIAFVSKKAYLQNILSAYGAVKPFMVSELALLCGPQWWSPSCTTYDPAEAAFDRTKSYFVAKAYSISIAEGLFASIYYDLSSTSFRNTSLLYPNHSYRSPSPFHAFKTARDSIKTGFLESEIKKMSSGKLVVHGYIFNRGDRHIWILWSRNGQNQNYNLPALPLAAWDVWGAPISVTSKSLSVGIAPIYLEYP